MPVISRWEYKNSILTNESTYVLDISTYKDFLHSPGYYVGKPLLQGVIEFEERQIFFNRVLKESRCLRDDLVKKDSLGRTPLRVAIGMAGSYSNHNYLDRWEALYIDTVLQSLLNDSPQETCSHPMDNKGTLRIHFVLHNGVGLEEGFQILVDAYLDALSIPDPSTRLIPCLLVAVGERSRVGTIFGLMIERPNLIVELCSGNPGIGNG